MIVTRVQAQEMWCPFTRAANGSGGAYNRLGSVGDLPGATRCLADRCMAWRWVEPGAMEDERKGVCGLPQPPMPGHG